MSDFITVYKLKFLKKFEFNLENIDIEMYLQNKLLLLIIKIS